MSKPPVPLPASPHKHLGWASWQHSEALLTQVKAKIWQGERFHLYCMHSLMFPDIIQKLRLRLSAMVNAPVSVSAECIWIDARPQAHWPGGNVELADLLVDVTVTKGAATTRRAVLLQAKYCDWDNLGSTACKPGVANPTNKERDLLETYRGKVELYASNTRTTGIPLPAPGNEFDVSADKKRRKLIYHSRYLLFPNQCNLSGTPYLAITPKSRVLANGQYHEDYEDLLCRMSLPHATTVQDVQPGKQWTALIDGLNRWATQKARDNLTVSRVGQKFPYKSFAFATLSHFDQLIRPGGCMLIGVHKTHVWYADTAGFKYQFDSPQKTGGGGRQPSIRPFEGDRPRGYWLVQLWVDYP